MKRLMETQRDEEAKDQGNLKWKEGTLSAIFVIKTSRYDCYFVSLI